MTEEHRHILTNLTVLAALKQAWTDSRPGITGGHEEGGFILREPSGELRVSRWLRGEKNRIIVPPHPNCQMGEKEIVASFHTHPNTGHDHIQEPSETDRRAVRDDPNLKGQFYAGEFIISQQSLYLVAITGEVKKIAETRKLFEGGETWQQH